MYLCATIAAQRFSLLARTSRKHYAAQYFTPDDIEYYCHCQAHLTRFKSPQVLISRMPDAKIPLHQYRRKCGFHDTISAAAISQTLRRGAHTKCRIDAAIYDAAWFSNKRRFATIAIKQ